jgi:spore coat polysaccharide biosynthesis protein SpsF
VVLIPDNPSEDKLAAKCRRLKVECFRGSEDDVLDRYYACACHYNADPVVRLTSDDPFVDWKVIARAINKFTRFDCDYVSNAWPGRETYPEGLDVQIISFTLLETMWREAREAHEREHVVPWVWERKHSFHIKHERNRRDYSHYRWTVDYASDLAMVSDVVGHFGDKPFLMDELIHYWFEFPEKARTKRDVERKQGIRRSMNE